VERPLTGTLAARAGYERQRIADGRDQFRSHRQGADEFVLELSCEPGLAASLEEAPLVWRPSSLTFRQPASCCLSIT
jgi:hypothetical protein